MFTKIKAADITSSDIAKKPGSREAVLSKESSYEKYEIERGYHLMYIGKSRKFSKELSFGLVPCYLY